MMTFCLKPFPRFVAAVAVFFSGWGLMGCNHQRSHPVPFQPNTAPVMRSPASASPPATPQSAIPADVAQQFEHGKRVYGNHCAGCHGGSGQGGEMAPPLVGANALPLYPRSGSSRQQPFHTAMDIAVFATQTMPPDPQDRSQLSEQDYWAVLAFALAANGVKLAEPAGPNNAAGIVIHP